MRLRVTARTKLTAAFRILGLALAVAAALVAPGAGPAQAAGGNSITSPDTAGIVGTYTSLALDGSGNPVVAYHDLTTSDGDLKVLHCNDPDCAGGDESVVAADTTGNVGSHTSLALDALGHPVVAYFDATNSDLKVLHCNDPDCAGGDESIIAPDTAGLVGMFTSLALDGSGDPVVSYYDQTNGDLKVLHCNDAACAGGDDSIATPDAAGDVGYQTSLALDVSGNPVVSYFDNANGDLTTGNLKLLHCDDPDCAAGGESVTSPATASYWGLRTSLALDASGNPVVAYADMEGNLTILRCDDPNCAAGGESITAPEPGGFDEWLPSLVVDASGSPVVTYTDSFINLKVLHCGAPSCLGANSVVTADAAGAVGEHSSLRLDSSGLAVVSYHDGWPNDDLKVLHCATPTCDPDFDGDGCPDVKEDQTSEGSETSGGRRNIKNPWDYFNPTGDGQNRVDDILAIVQKYFVDFGNPNYTTGTDRTYEGPNPWNLGPPNGQIRVDDILNNVKQYFHDCG